MRKARRWTFLLPLWIGLLLVAQGCPSHKKHIGKREPTPGAGGPAYPDAPTVSDSCIACHGLLDAPTMHPTGTVEIGCVDCHGGNGRLDPSTNGEFGKGSGGVQPGILEQVRSSNPSAYEKAKNQAHVKPKYPKRWKSSANPELSDILYNEEHPSYIRFVNPGDLRVAGVTCGGCHAEEVRKVRRSMMAHGAMLWGAALYNNGVVPFKNPRFGEAYGPHGTPLRLKANPSVSAEEMARTGKLPYLDPLPRFEVGQPSNILRVFERGGRFLPALPGLPNPLQEPGRPDRGLSPRGLGTLNRTDPVWLNLQKTRLLDPLLYFPGTNHIGGEYRGSGCTGCHVLYANDRDPVHSGPIAKYGNEGKSFSTDPTIPKNERGHPIAHRFTRAVPSSQCIVCHVHPGTTVTNTYLGTLWWDNETEGHRFYPKKQRYPSEKERLEKLRRNPNEASVRGLWSDYDFLRKSADMNPTLEKVQLADFHGHGWLFRKVFSRDRKGNLLDEHGRIVSPEDPERFKKAVHLKDIHLERGMHCVDCHFEQDVHGDGQLYGSVRDAIEITCEDCHGTVSEHAALKTSGPAAPEGGHDLTRMRTPFGKRRFLREGQRVIQNSMVDPKKSWEIPQIADGAKRNPLSWLAKTIQKDNKTWGKPGAKLAHDRKEVTCFSCHSSWMASCFGCHLPMRANQKTPYLHNEGDDTRNYTPYCFQTIRADTYMLGKDGTVTGNKVAPVRSACAVLVGSQNANREWVYSQQQTVSAEGYSGIAFSPHVPHTVRKKETKTCTDCHLSRDEDNNAWMAQILMQGAGSMNFMFRYVYVGTDHGIEAIVVTERDEPQAVIGSTLHRDAFPDFYKAHLKRDRVLEGGYLFNPKHHTKGAQSVQLRGEYLYVADGSGGLRVLDVAQVDQKGFSERIVTAPLSPLDQRFYVKSKDAAFVASPATMAVDPVRTQYKENQEQKIHLLYGFLYVADRKEGLILVGAATLLDGNPRNNVLKRALTFNPKGILKGARHAWVAGRYVYVCCDRGVVVVDVDNPLKPKVAGTIDVPGAQAVTVQFRYAFVAADAGLAAVDITPEADGSFPKDPKIVSFVDLKGARRVYVGRTYAYVAAGHRGLGIVDVERPTAMKLLETYNAGGKINDCQDVALGITNVSLFAYLADGRNGLRVLQLTSPEETPGNLGFSPRPQPRLIASFPTKGRALSITRGLDRDRAVDESGNQIAVFNRVGSRPFTFKEMQRLYRLPNGRLFKVPALRNLDDLRREYPNR